MNTSTPKSLTARFRAFFTSRLSARWFAHLALVEVLIFSLVVLPSVSVRAGFADSAGNYDIWTEAGRAGHGFAIQEATDPNSPVHFNGGGLWYPGGNRISGNYNGGVVPNGMIIRDLTTNEIAPLPDDGNGLAVIQPGAWTVPGSGNPQQTIHFSVEGREGNSFAILHQNGTVYPATPAPSWLNGYYLDGNGWVESDVFGYAASFDPSSPFRIIDVTNNQQFEEGSTFASANGVWEAIPEPPPLQSVTIVLPAFTANQNFTVRSQIPWGPVMHQSVTAEPCNYWYDWAINTNFYVWSDDCAILTFTAPVGSSFRITYDAGGSWPIDGSSYAVPDPSFTLGSFDALDFQPPPPPPTTEVTLRISGTNWDWATGAHDDLANHAWQLWTNAGMVASYDLEVWNGFIVENQYLSTFDGRLLANPISVLRLTAQVPEGADWWVVDATTGQTMPIGHADFLNGWTPQFQYPTDTSSLDIHAARLNPSGDGWVSVGIAPNDYQTTLDNTSVRWISGPMLNGALPAGTVVNYEREFWNESTFEYYTLPYTRLDFEVPGEWLGGYSVVVHWGFEQSTPVDVFSLSVGATDNTTWLPAPQPVYLNISESRWGHDLVLRHVDGREYPIYPGQTQGDTSWNPGSANHAWVNSYYYFDANTQATPGLAWYVVDKTAGESAGYGEIDLAAWYYVPPPTFDELMEVTVNEAYSIKFTLPTPNLAGVVIEVRSPDTGNTWVEIERLVDGLDTTQQLSHSLPAFEFGGMGYLEVRLRSIFGSAVSQPSAVGSIYVTHTDSDQDGAPNIWERDNGFDPHDALDGFEDTDGDGAPNYVEWMFGDDPNYPDAPLYPPSIDIALQDSFRYPLPISLDKSAIRISWDVRSYPEIEKVILLRSVDNDPKWEVLAGPNELFGHYDDSGLKSNCVYSYKIAATDRFGRLGYSDVRDYEVPLVRSVDCRVIQYTYRFPCFRLYPFQSFDASGLPPVGVIPRKFTKVSSKQKRTAVIVDPSHFADRLRTQETEGLNVENELNASIDLDLFKYESSSSQVNRTQKFRLPANTFYGQGDETIAVGTTETWYSKQSVASHISDYSRNYFYSDPVGVISSPIVSSVPRRTLVGKDFDGTQEFLMGGPAAPRTFTQLSSEQWKVSYSEHSGLPSGASVDDENEETVTLSLEKNTSDYLRVLCSQISGDDMIAWPPLGSTLPSVVKGGQAIGANTVDPLEIIASNNHGADAEAEFDIGEKELSARVKIVEYRLVFYPPAKPAIATIPVTKTLESGAASVSNIAVSVASGQTESPVYRAIGPTVAMADGDLSVTADGLMAAGQGGARFGSPIPIVVRPVVYMDHAIRHRSSSSKSQYQWNGKLSFPSPTVNATTFRLGSSQPGGFQEGKLLELEGGGFHAELDFVATVGNRASDFLPETNGGVIGALDVIVNDNETNPISVPVQVQQKISSGFATDQGTQIVTSRTYTGGITVNSLPVVLHPGWNSIQLRARDPMTKLAGGQTYRVLVSRNPATGEYEIPAGTGDAYPYGAVYSYHQSEPGPVHPAAIQVVVPVGYESIVTEVEFGGKTWNVIRVAPGLLVVGDGDTPHPFFAVHPSHAEGENPLPNPSAPLPGCSDIPDLPVDTKNLVYAYSKGFASGFADGGWQLVSGTWHAATGTVKHIGNVVAGYYFLVRVLINNENTEAYDSMMYFTNEVNEGNKTAQQLGEIARKAGNFVLEHQEGFYRAVLFDDYTLYDKVAEQDAQMFGMMQWLAGMFLEDCLAKLDQMSSVQQAEEIGRLVGRASFEIVAILAPFSKGGKLAEFTKAKRLEIVEKLNNSDLVKAHPTLANGFQKVVRAYIYVTRAPICFTAGTLVWSEAGLVPIESIEPSTLVLSRNEGTGEYGLRPVIQNHVSYTTALLRLRFRTGEWGQAASGAETICTTGPHPFWVNGKGFTPADALRVGDIMELADGRRVELVAVDCKILEPPVPVYNIEVDEFHTYFVGNSGIWVHNLAKDFCENWARTITDVKAKLKNLGRWADEFDVDVPARAWEVADEALPMHARKGRFLAEDGNLVQHDAALDANAAFAKLSGDEAAAAYKAGNYRRSWAEQRSNRDYYGGAGAWEIHHMCEKRIARALGIRDSVPGGGVSRFDREIPSICLPERPPPHEKGITEAELARYKKWYAEKHKILENDVPVVYHQTDLVPDIKTKIFEKLDISDSAPGILTPKQKSDILRELRSLYMSEKYKHLNMWPQVREFVRANLKQPGITIPD